MGGAIPKDLIVKWFTHDCDMHTDLKIQVLIQREGLEGYAVYNLCLELLGKEGKKGRLDASTNWKNCLLKVCQGGKNFFQQPKLLSPQGRGKVEARSDEGGDIERLNNVLNTLAELRLIDSKALKYGHLHCKNFMKRADNWTKRQLRSNFGVSTQKVPLHNNTIQYITKQYNTLKGYRLEDYSHNDHLRTRKAISQLRDASQGDEQMIIDCLNYVDNIATQQGWHGWTLETCIKRWQDFLKWTKQPALLKELNNGNGTQKKKFSS